MRRSLTFLASLALAVMLQGALLLTAPPSMANAPGGPVSAAGVDVPDTAQFAQYHHHHYRRHHHHHYRRHHHGYHHHHYRPRYHHHHHHRRHHHY